MKRSAPPVGLCAMVVGDYDGRDPWVVVTHLPQMLRRPDVVGVAHRDTVSKDGKGQMGFLLFATSDAAFAFAGDTSDSMEDMRSDARDHGFVKGRICQLAGEIEFVDDNGDPEPPAEPTPDEPPPGGWPHA